MRRLLIDTDTASDDAVALVMALRDRRAKIEAITVVAGNVPLEQGVQNALYTVDLCSSHVPIFAGAEAPLQRALETAQFVHGQDGMGDIGLELSGRVPAVGHAVDAIVDTFQSAPGQIDLVTLGPLTNIARALQQAPEIAKMVKHCYLMGGIGSGPGNVTPVAEFNLWVDPEAAQIVFGSGLPITMVGWEISTRFATIGPDEAEEIRALGTPLARFCMDIQATLTSYATEVSGLRGFDLPDPVTMAIALDPSIATKSDHAFVEVRGGDAADRGRTLIDLGRTANAEVVREADRAKFLDMLKSSLC